MRRSGSDHGPGRPGLETHKRPQRSTQSRGGVGCSGGWHMLTRWLLAFFIVLTVLLVLGLLLFLPAR